METGACPHTAVREDPSMNLAAVEDMEARFPDTDVVLIESGGDNLTLTFSPALVDFFIYVIDVAAGDKIPRKNGPGITQSDILVINKTDLAPYVGRRAWRSWTATRTCMRGGKPFVFTNCKTGEGIDELVTLIRRERRSSTSTCVAGMITLGHARRNWPPYQDEPAQLPAALRRQGRRAAPAVRAPRRPHDPRDLYRQAPLLVQRALYCDEGMPRAALRHRSSPTPAASSRATATR